MIRLPELAASPSRSQSTAGGRVPVLLTTAIAPAVWGTTYLVTTELLPPGRPLLAATLRALPAGLLLVTVTRRLPRGVWWRALVLGCLNIGAFFALLFVAAYRLPGGVAATLGAVQPLVVLALAAGLLGQPPTRWRLGAGVAGVAGVALMVLTGGARLDVVGLAAGFAATASMATGTVLTKRWGRPVPLLAFTGWQLLAGGLALLPPTLLVEGAPDSLDLRAMAGYVWLGLVGTTLAYALWFRGIEQLPAQAVTFLGLLSPAVATLAGWVVAGQNLTLTQLTGLALAMIALLAGQRSPAPPSGTLITPPRPICQPVRE
jgi:probable blue pigment (indigoidine) exporter